MLLYYKQGSKIYIYIFYLIFFILLLVFIQSDCRYKQWK